MVLILGLDPSLARTGWGVIEADGNRLRHVAHGAIKTAPSAPLSARLLDLYQGLLRVTADHRPAEAAIEEVFVNRNPQSTLKLGEARGVVLLAAAALPVFEYATRLVKKALVGTGGATKEQVAAMVGRLLPSAPAMRQDESDALAVAIAHAHWRTSPRAQNAAGAKGAAGAKNAVSAMLFRGAR